MPKFDFNKLTEKFDIKGVVDSVKSIINPEVGIPKNLEGDPIAAKLALIRVATENLNTIMQQQQDEINKINALIASLYKDLEAKMPPTATTGSTETPKPTEPSSTGTVPPKKDEDK